MVEESARANPDTRIRPLTHASVDRASQAESVGSNLLVSILIAIRRSPNFMSKKAGEVTAQTRSKSLQLGAIFVHTRKYVRTTQEYQYY